MSPEAGQRFSIPSYGTRDFPSGAIRYSCNSLKRANVNLPGLRLDRVHIHAGGRRTLNLPRVLLADDHHSLLQAEIDLLSAYFDVVGTAADGAALVAEAGRLHPDVIVTDISMPILSGIDAVHKLQESGSRAKFVFVTVHSEGEFVDACMRVGVVGYVHKACISHHLVPAIKAVLENRSYVSRLDSHASRKRAG